VLYGKTEAWCNFRFLSGDPAACESSGERFEARLEKVAPGVFRYRLSGPRWPDGSGSDAALSAQGLEGGGSDARLSLGPGFELSLSVAGREILASAPGKGFGLNGKKWILCFQHSSETRYYGMGEKGLGFELSGKRSLFWNSDVMAEFHPAVVGSGETDPLYASLPVLLMKRSGLWCGIVVDNPYAVFMNLGAGEGIFQEGAAPFEKYLFLGSSDGEPDLYFIAGRDPAEVVRRVQALQGRTPLPPLWALGHQQCRWGYRSYEDLDRVASEYEKRKIPDDGLWLDIDYMDGFRVFSLDPRRWDRAREKLASLKARGYAVVPILDPGLRRDPGYRVYAAAKERGVLCLNPEGGEFIGYVWPGYTVFPDFSLKEGRDFWSDEVRDLALLGFSGFWIDMNDPSTGSVPAENMLFRRGRLPHAAYHNQYALGMARATRAGLLAARPEERPFLVSRSAFLGMARESAIWMGDNVSNEAHLALSIPMALNLSVSGLPFLGADVPGFAGKADARLMRDWYKASFLFPFLRNHNVVDAPDQEPWTRGPRTESVVAGLIRSRYRLLPYLYNLFIDQEEDGDPILRPLWYHDPSPECELIGDQFLVGADIMQAPILGRTIKRRRLYLPAGRWFEARSGKFLEGGRWIEASDSFSSTPLYFRSPSIIPLMRGKIEKPGKDLSAVDFLLVIEKGQRARYRYRMDDGISYSYRKGGRSLLELEVERPADILRARTELLSRGAGGLSFRFLVAGKAPTLEHAGQEFALKKVNLGLAGSKLALRASGIIDAGK
jgi:alpha-glucosidase